MPWPIFPHRVTVRAADFSELGDCDLLINSVGKIDLLRGTHDRVTEMDFTIPAVRSFVDKVKASGFNGVVINITNPCDIVTRELALHLGLPRGRVFGTGTGLDTARLPQCAGSVRPVSTTSPSPLICWANTAISSLLPLALRQLPGQISG